MRPAKPPSSTKPLPLKQGYLGLKLDCKTPSLPQAWGRALLVGGFLGGKVKVPGFLGLTVLQPDPWAMGVQTCSEGCVSVWKQLKVP